MWELDRKEGLVLKNWCFWSVVLEKTLESPLDNKEIKPINPKGNQRWIFIRRTDAEAEAPILWPPDVKSWLIGKDPDAGKDWGQEENRVTENEMVGWHHWLNGHEFEQTPGDSEGQGSLGCCSPWIRKSRIWFSDWTTTTTHLAEGKPPAPAPPLAFLSHLRGEEVNLRSTLYLVPAQTHKLSEDWDSIIAP